ncbi:MAG TPA: hypothetical protein VJG83_01325 [archaeon]|nr:hypothetical protein [archaeon]
MQPKNDKTPQVNLEWIWENAYFLFAFLFVFGYIAFFILVPFFQHNNLFSYDMAGSYFSAWYTKEYLFPSPVGWNPYFFFGFAQSQFYAPLFSYLSAALAFVVPIDIAFKSVLSLVVLLTPVSFYYFARSFGFSINNCAAIMLLMFALLFAFPEGNYGANINATFGVGFVAQALSIPLFFFYFGALKNSLKTREFVLPSLLLALTILAHTWTGIGGILIAIAFFVSDPKVQAAIYFAKHLFLSFLLTAFWAVPVIAKKAYVAVGHIGKMAFSFEMLAVAIVLTFFMWRSKQDRIMQVPLFLVAILIISIIGDSFNLPFHPYRLTMLVYLMAPIILFYFWKNSLDMAWRGICIIVAVFIIFSIPNLEPQGYSTIKNPIMLPEGLDGRVLINAPPSRQANPHELTEIIPMQNKVHSVIGLFSDSSKNSRYAFNLLREFDNTNLNWGVASDVQRVDLMGEDAKNLIPGQLERFGIKYVLTSDPPLDGWRLVANNVYTPRNSNNFMEQYHYSLYAANNTQIIEVLDFVPRYVPEEKWEGEVVEWFFSPQINQTLLVNEPVRELKGSGSESVQILEQSPTMEYIRFNVNSEKVVPVLIKISEFPNWRAYSEGKELKIYRASPHFMLIYTKGETELRYEQTIADVTGILLSAIGALVVLYLGILRKNKTKNKGG